MDEHRSTKRHRVLTGSIQIGGAGAIDCTVRNLSHFGAALDVQSPVGIPDEFISIVPSDGFRLASRMVGAKSGG